MGSDQQSANLSVPQNQLLGQVTHHQFDLCHRHTLTSSMKMHYKGLILVVLLCAARLALCEDSSVCEDCECYCLLLDEHGIDWREIGEAEETAVTKETADRPSRTLQAAIGDVLLGVGFTSSGIPSGSFASKNLNPEDTSAYGAYFVAGLNALGGAAVEWTRKMGFKTGS